MAPSTFKIRFDLKFEKGGQLIRYFQKPLASSGGKNLVSKLVTAAEMPLKRILVLFKLIRTYDVHLEKTTR